MVEKHTSQNGVRIVLENVPEVRSVTIGIWVLAGSRNEGIHNNGISHFLEHMFFKGTKTRDALEIAESFDAIGAQINAFTSKEYTCYFVRVLDTHKEYALEMLADMFFDSIFAEEEIKREKKVVYEEIKMYEDTPDDIVHDLLAKAAYGDHPLGYPILGTDESLKEITREALYTYKKERYTAENVVISVAGNVDNSFITVVEDHFERLKSQSEQAVVEKPSFLTNDMERNKDAEQAHLTLGYNGLQLGDERSSSLIIMNNVLGGSMSSRLFQEVREKQGLAYTVFSYHSSFLDNGLLTIYAGTGKEQLPQLQDTINRTVEHFIANGLTDKELKNSKEQLKSNMVLGLESTNSRMSRNGRNELLLDRHRTVDEVIKDIDGVSHASIQEVIDMTFKQAATRAIIAPK
ncbi:MAG TPA: pitrilysin family protein [Virgibacillus sp.]|nr:pitrilysin family protein [Virgibacillus sp.]